MKRPSEQEHHKNATEHLSPEGDLPQLLRRCTTVGEKGSQPAQRALDLACLCMGPGQRQCCLPLMARLCAHGGEPLRSTRDGFPMLPGNRQPHQHRPPVIDERHLPRHYLTSCQVLGRVPAPTPIDA